MKRSSHTLRRGLLVSGAALLVGCAPPPDLAADGGEQDLPTPLGSRALRDVLRRSGPHDRVPVLVKLADEVDVRSFTEGDRRARRAALITALRAQADRSQGPLLARLHEGGATALKPLWIVNAVAAKVEPALARALMGFPGVTSVALDASVTAVVAASGGASPAEWNLAAIEAPKLWKQGTDGAGVVVANMDTGVDLGHVDLQAKWRGGTDSWFDPHGNSTAPYDAIGHGTQTMGILVGGTAGGTAIGVAPGARWIAAKIYDDEGDTTVSVIHASFEWLLAPSGVPGAADAPDIVNASWGLTDVNGCDDTFQGDVATLRAAGILVAFAAGNAGPSALTSISPANDVGGFSAGAVDASRAVAFFSSRGPSACGGGTFPDLVAPGVGVKTADISIGGAPQYTDVTGTSLSAPHVAGAAALLASAFPAAMPAELEDALRSTAADLGPTGPDDDYGYGLVDVYAAYASMAATAPLGITTSTMKPAQLGKGYAQALKAVGGVKPYAWSVVAGALPPGLKLGVASGVVVGSPGAKGSYAFTAQVLDGKSAGATRSLALVIP